MQTQYKSCAFSGHRDIPEADITQIYAHLTTLLRELIDNGCTDFYAGGALGFDTIAALIVLQLRGEYPDIKLHLLLPYADQSGAWQQSDCDTYEFIKSHSNSFEYLSKDYYRGCMQARNKALVDKSELVVCYMTRNIGGTANTIRYAKSCGRRVINIAPAVSALK